MNRRALARPRARHVTLFDPAGRPFNATATVTAWRGSGNPSGRRARGWYVNDSAINALLAGDVAEMRRRSHDIQRKSPHADSALDAYVAACVGNGIVPVPLTEDDDLRRELLEAWDEFVEECDADGQSDFYGIQALVCRSYREGGDSFVRFRPRRPSDGLCVPLQLQVLEAELVDPSYEEPQRPGGGRIQAGIEFDGVGRRVAYHMWREHPNDMSTFRNMQRVAVPAENVMHVYEVMRPGQIRGVPALSPAMAKLWDVEVYEDAEVKRKQVAAMFAGFVKNPNAIDNPLDAGTAEGEDDDGRPLASLEPGTMQELDPGQDITFSQPADVGNSFEPFLRSQLRQVAVTGEVTYEEMTGDLTGVNYSSARVGTINSRRRMDQKRRNVLIFQFCRRTWRRFAEAAVLCGRIALPSDPKKLRDLTRVAWMPTPGKEYVDPEKEVRAVIARMRAGLISRSKAVAECGYDAEALEREIATDNARSDALGLRFDGDARYALYDQTRKPNGSSSSSGERDDSEMEEEEMEEAEARALVRAMQRLAARGELPGF